METKCQNCGANVTSKFCGECGQIANTHRINLHFLWHDIQHGLFHFDKGVIYTFKELFTRPGSTIREFLEGKRVKHFKPVSLVILLAGIYGFLSHYLHVNLLSSQIQIKGSSERVSLLRDKAIILTEWLSAHYAVLALVQIPIFALVSYFIYRKFKYNYIECLVISTFITCQRLFVQIMAFPIFYLLRDSQYLKAASSITDIISYLLFGWSLFQLFNNLSTFQKLIRIVLVFVAYFLVLIVLLSIIIKITVSNF